MQIWGIKEILVERNVSLAGALADKRCVNERSCALSVFPSCSPGMNKFANMFQSKRLIKTDRLQYRCKSGRVWALLDREDLGDMYKRQPARILGGAAMGVRD